VQELLRRFPIAHDNNIGFISSVIAEEVTFANISTVVADAGVADHSATPFHLLDFTFHNSTSVLVQMLSCLRLMELPIK
jgi:hypothetical protein